MYDFIQQTLNNIMYNVNVLVNYKFTGAYALQTKHEVKMTGYWPSSQWFCYLYMYMYVLHPWHIEIPKDAK